MADYILHIILIFIGIIHVCEIPNHGTSTKNRLRRSGINTTSKIIYLLIRFFCRTKIKKYMPVRFFNLTICIKIFIMQGRFNPWNMQLIQKTTPIFRGRFRVNYTCPNRRTPSLISHIKTSLPPPSSGGRLTIYRAWVSCATPT